MMIAPPYHFTAKRLNKNQNNMKDFFRIVAFLFGFAGYALLAGFIAALLDGIWVAPYIYGVASLGGFTISYILRDADKTCPCCKAVEQKEV